MSITIPDAEPVRVGDAVELPFELTDEETGDAIDLSTGTIEWSLRRDVGYSAAVTLADSDVSIINRDNPNGEFSVKLDTGATEELEVGTYRERVTFTDSAGNETTWIGELPLKSDE